MIEHRGKLIPEHAKKAMGYSETEINFFDGNRQVYNAYMMSEGDKCALDYISRCITNVALDSCHVSETKSDPHDKKMSTKLSGRDVDRHFGLLELTLVAIQIIFVLAAFTAFR